MTNGSTIIPGMRYRDAQAAIDWLGKAFGFETGLVVPDGEGGIAHAQLTYGTGMIMLGSARDDDFGKSVRPPDTPTDPVNQSVCVIVEDADAHYEQARAAGAKITMDIADQPYGGRGYACRDPEGFIWWFGSYDPWAEA